MSECANKRNLTIDVAKGIAILLVILGHMNRFFEYQGRMNRAVYSVQLPVFLLLGGYWMRLKDGENFGQFVKKQFYRLLQPYFFFAFFSILYTWPENEERFCYYIAGMMWGIGIYDYLPNLPIWFLPMFFVAHIWFYLVLRAGAMGRKAWQVFLLEAAAASVVMAIGWNIKEKGQRFPWGFEIAMIIQGFFLAGHWWKWAEGRIFPNRKVTRRQKQVMAALIIPAVLIWAVCVKQNGRVDINAAWFGEKGLLSYYLAALTGCYLVILVSAMLAKCPPAAWLLSLFGRHSMAIMALHVPVMIWLDGVVTPLMPAIIQANHMSKNWIGITYHFVVLSLLSLFAALLLTKNPYHKN